MTSIITLIILLLATPASTQTVTMLQPTTSQTLSSPVTVTCTNSTPESWINFYLDNAYKASSPPYTQLITASPGNHTFKCSGYHGSSILDGTASASVTVISGPTPSSTPTTPTPTPTPTPYTTPTPTSSPTPIVGAAKPFSWRWSYSTQNKTLLSGGRWQQNCSMPRTWNYPLWIETQTDSLLCNTGTAPVTFNYGVGVTCPSEVSLPMRPYVSMSHPDYTNVPLAAGQCMKFNLNRIDAAVTPDGNTPLTPPVNLLPASSGCYPAPALVIQLVTGTGPLNIQSDELMLGTPLTIGNIAMRRHKATAHRRSPRYSRGHR